MGLDQRDINDIVYLLAKEEVRYPRKEGRIHEILNKLMELSEQLSKAE
jgi:hypothetical protein